MEPYRQRQWWASTDSRTTQRDRSTARPPVSTSDAVIVGRQKSARAGPSVRRRRAAEGFGWRWLRQGSRFDGTTHYWVRTAWPGQHDRRRRRLDLPSRHWHRSTPAGRRIAELGNNSRKRQHPLFLVAQLDKTCTTSVKRNVCTPTIAVCLFSGRLCDSYSHSLSTCSQCPNFVVLIFDLLTWNHTCHKEHFEHFELSRTFRCQVRDGRTDGQIKCIGKWVACGNAP